MLYFNNNNNNNNNNKNKKSLLTHSKQIAIYKLKFKKKKELLKPIYNSFR